MRRLVLRAMLLLIVANTFATNFLGFFALSCAEARAENPGSSAKAIKLRKSITHIRERRSLPLALFERAIGGAQRQRVSGDK